MKILKPLNIFVLLPLMMLLFLGNITLVSAKSKKIVIAVYPTIVADGARDPAKYSYNIQEITAKLEEGLRSSRRFKMYERNTEILAKSVLTEQNFAQSDLAAGNAAEFGKLSNVGLVVQPIVSKFSMGAAFKKQAGLPGIYSRTDNGKLEVTFKILDTTTGEIKTVVSEEAKYHFKVKMIKGRKGGPGKPVYRKLVSNVTQLGTNSIVNVIFPILVMKAKGRQIYLNRGKGGGLKVGEIMTLYSAGEELIDPSSGEVLGSEEMSIGKVRIKRVTPKFSIAVPVGDLDDDPKVGDIIRSQ
jgi:hypothetical protein